MDHYYQHVKEIVLPPVPNSFREEALKLAKERLSSPDAHTQYSDPTNKAASFSDSYDWIPASDELQKWCQQNISPGIVFGIQIISGNLPKHRDRVTNVKFVNNLYTGGTDVVTRFFEGDEVVTSITFKENVWYVLNVAQEHDVINVSGDQLRIAITGRISP